MRELIPLCLPPPASYHLMPSRGERSLLCCPKYTFLLCSERLIAFIDRAVSETNQPALKPLWLMNQSVRFDLSYIVYHLSSLDYKDRNLHRYVANPINLVIVT